MLMNVQLTNIALDIVRADLDKKKDKFSLNLIEELLAVVGKEGEGLEPLQRTFHEELGPRRFLEELCYAGLSSGVAESDASEGRSQTNILKLAQTILDTRFE